MNLIKHPADILTWVALVWIVITILLNFVIPVSWYFQYEGMETPSEVCVNETHMVTGTYWAAFPLPASGVDHIVSGLTDIRKDRFEWQGTVYQQGYNEATWQHVANLVPGEYQIENTELKLDLLRVFPVYLNNEERPVSNTFTVVECN